MAKVLVTETYLEDIGDAIRGRNGLETTYKPSEMPAAIEAIPNSYTEADEGKVVDNGALVAQTSQTITENGTYDTTLIDEAVVNVSGGGGGTIEPLSVTQNGTYTPPSGVDGYAPVTVNVSGGSTSDNDLLFHFDDNFDNVGKTPCLFSNVTGLSISDEQSKFGSHSLKCGTSQTKDNVALKVGTELGSTDFTLDFWIYPTSMAASGSTKQVPVSFNYRSLAIYINQASFNLAVTKTSGSWTFDIIENVSIANNQWHHIAIVRDGVNIYSFLDGIKVHDINFGSDAVASITPMTVGSNSYSNGDRRFNGYIDELRLKLGEAVWTDNFTPPTQPYS